MIDGITLLDQQSFKRKLPLNLSSIDFNWQEIFLNIRTQELVKIKFYIYNDAIIDSENIVWIDEDEMVLDHHEPSERRMIKNSFKIPSKKEALLHPQRYYRYLKKRHNHIKSFKNIEILDKTDCYLLFWDDRCRKNLFHWLIDALPRLILALERFSNCKLILPKSFFKRDYVPFTLNQLGINLEKIIVISNEKKYFANTIISITPAIFSTGACSVSLVKKINSHFRISKSRACEFVYLKRSENYKGRKIINQSEFDVLLSSNNFQIIVPEKLSMENLIRKLNKTKILISIYSASLAHMVFMKPNNFVIEIVPPNFAGDTPDYWKGFYPSSFSGDYYYSLSSALELNYQISFAKFSSNSKDALTSDVVVDLDNIQKLINQARLYHG